ncbi:MAG: hypothetical protein ACOVP4_14275 [Bacteriovoracaceae bacterium]
MRPLFFSLLLLFSFSVMAQEITCEAMVRDEKHNLIRQKVSLEDLTSADAFAGRFFKIVSAKDEKPVKLGQGDLSFRACTVYYHLTKARKYFIENFNDRHVRALKELTIRIEMPFSFIDSSHFMSDDYKTYNNSLTIPPSGRNKLAEIEPWNYEIWFAPKKKIKRKSAIEQAAKLLQGQDAQFNLRIGVLAGVGSNIATQVAQGLTLTSLEGKMYVESLLVSLAAVTITPWLIEKFSLVFKPTIYLDTALIPEVIYHEYGHIAFAKHLRPTHHSPIIEGYANFFAADIGNTDTILKKTRGLSKGLDKLNPNKKIMYDTWMEDRQYAQYGFTFGLLWDIRKALGPEVARKLLYKAHEKLNSSSNVRTDLLTVLEDTSRDMFSNSEHKKIILTLANVWQNRGL